MGLAGPRALESSSLISSKGPFDERSARRRSSRGDPLPPERVEPGGRSSIRPPWMRTAHFLLDKPGHLFKKKITRAPRTPFEDKTKGVNRALRARVAASIRGLLIFPHFDITKKGLDMTPPVLAAAPHGQVTREASHGHVHQDTQARMIITFIYFIIYRVYYFGCL